MEYDIYISSVNNILKKYKKRDTLLKKIHESTIDFYVNSLKINEKVNKDEVKSVYYLNNNIQIPDYSSYKIKNNKNNINKNNINVRSVNQENICCALEWSPKGEKNRCSRNKENNNDFCSLHINYRPYGVYE